MMRKNFLDAIVAIFDIKSLGYQISQNKMI